jgi:hypothetical protein
LAEEADLVSFATQPPIRVVAASNAIHLFMRILLNVR